MVAQWRAPLVRAVALHRMASASSPRAAGSKAEMQHWGKRAFEKDLVESAASVLRKNSTCEISKLSLRQRVEVGDMSVTVAAHEMGMTDNCADV
ncbi:hypothetical protein EDC01DRAFT_778727 [Geopyxis carbonaria]|nr:hypothetical protein EDC01DRAFT_778727 [Geopyxis carbonaria]